MPQWDPVRPATQQATASGEATCGLRLICSLDCDWKGLADGRVIAQFGLVRNARLGTLGGCA